MENNLSVPFIKPVFKGDRFKNHHLPLQVLPDLLAYENIVRAVARELYFSSHKDRTRLPKGFQDCFKLDLIDIQSGSVVPVLSRESESEEETNDEFTLARNLINEFVASVNEKKPLEKFPKKIIYLFEDLGRTLRDDESIELRIPGENNSPVYSKQIRSKILSISKKPYLDICCLTGFVSGYDAEKRKLFIVLEDSQIIEGPLDQSFDSLLRRIANDYKNKKKDVAVTLTGIARYQPDGSIAEIKKLQHLIVYQEGVPEFFPDLSQQLRELTNLKDGWLDGEGVSFKQSDVDTVYKWLSELLKTGDIPTPFIYPSPNHSIECEWSFGYWEISFSFLLQQDIIVLHAAHVNSEEIREDRLVLEDSISIEKAQRFLNNLLHEELWRH